MSSLAAVLDRIERVSAAGAGLVIFAVMLIVAADVVMRYAFNAPFAWSYDVISIYLMAAAFFLSASDTLRRGHHVNVDLAYERFPPAGQRASKLLGWSLSAVLFGIMSMLAARSAWSRWQGGDVVAGAIPWPTWIPSALATFGLALLTIRLVLGSLGLALALVTGEGRLAAPANPDHQGVGDAL
jgi:TRAP-type C4-dicarboxylate transport system permease small subunit